MLSAIIIGDSTVPLLASNGNVPHDTEEEQKQKKNPDENSPEGTQDKTDSVTDLKEELCDLSVFKST